MERQQECQHCQGHEQDPCGKISKLNDESAAFGLREKFRKSYYHETQNRYDGQAPRCGQLQNKQGKRRQAWIRTVEVRIDLGECPPDELEQEPPSQLATSVVTAVVFVTTFMPGKTRDCCPVAWA